MRSPRPEVFAVALVLAASSVFVSSSTHAAEKAPDRKRVLFIGNSFTYVNDLPRIVSAMSRADGGPKFDCRMVAFPGYSSLSCPPASCGVGGGL